MSLTRRCAPTSPEGRGKPKSGEVEQQHLRRAQRLRLQPCLLLQHRGVASAQRVLAQLQLALGQVQVVVAPRVERQRQRLLRRRPGDVEPCIGMNLERRILATTLARPCFSALASSALCS
jgi:hypothetical protein